MVVERSSLPFKNEIVSETNLFEVGQDWEVPIPGFFIIAAKREEIKSIGDFNSKELKEFTQLLYILRKVMRKLGIETVMMFQDEEVDHFHMWILPRYPWMEKFGHKIESVRPILEFAKREMMTQEVFQEIKEYVSKARELMIKGFDY